MDGLFSTISSFDSDGLSVGYHKISFRVKDDDGAWSDSETEFLNIVDLEIPVVYDFTFNPDEIIGFIILLQLLLK